MIQYSERAKIAYARLYRPYNDIDIFVEDETCHNMYKILINRMLGALGRVERVIGMGSRQAVEAACLKDEEAPSRAKLYVVDGDMDIFRGKRRKRMARLYRLREYCIENVLLDEMAIYEVLRETMVDADSESIERAFGFEMLQRQIEGELLALWKLYAVAFDLRAEVDTVSYSVHRLRSAEGDRVDVSPALVRERIRTLVGELWRVSGKQRYVEARRSLRGKWAKRQPEGKNAISGKHCILPLVYYRCKVYGNYRDSEASLKVRLARHCDVRRDLGFYRAVRRELRKARR